MTLLVRDEADVVDAHIAFHLRAGVDFVIATDNCSQDATTEILERYEASGVLHLLREPGNDLRQSEWVTRMARLAATDFGAEWVINSDADEFWWPRCGSLKDVVGAVPARYGVVRGAWRIFVPRPDDDRFFAERMTVRLCAPEYHDHPFSTAAKSVHRASDEVTVGRGNHEAFAHDLIPLRGWFPIEVMHYPVRSLAQCTRKYVTQFLALERNRVKGIPGTVTDAHRAYVAGRPEDFFEPLVVHDSQLERGLADGTLAIDTRLRDALRAISPAGAVHPTFGPPGPTETAPTFPSPDIEEEAAFFSETSVIPEADLGLHLGDRVDGLEARVAQLGRGPLARFKRAFRAGRP
jgi:hypothetical protein